MNLRDRDDATVVRALREAGVAVLSVFDLVNGSRSYKAAIPALIDSLSQVSDPYIKEGIVRALSVKEARGQAARPLIAAYQAIAPADSDQQMLKWAIGNALATVATDADCDALAALATDRRHGKAREMVVVALGKMKQPRAVDVLIGLLDDEEVAGHAVMALRRLKARRALPAIERRANHTKPWVRSEVAKAVKQLR